MSKKVLSSIIALLFGLMITPTSAQHANTIPDYIPDEDSLAWRYIQKAISPKNTVNNAAFDYASLLDGKEAYVYSLLCPIIQQIASGERTSSIITLDLTNYFSKTRFTARDFGVASIMKNGDIVPEVTQQLEQELTLDIGHVIEVLMYNFPLDFFWYDKVIGYSYYFPTYTYSRNYVEINPTYIFRLTVVKEYQGADEYTVNPTFGQSLNTARENVKKIIDAHKDESDYQKLVSYQREIQNLVEYNEYAAKNDIPYGNPWQIIWVFDGDPNTKVVCEGYAKAFQYLCDNSTFDTDVYSICVAGFLVLESSDRHMWNIVHINGKNYLADITNSSIGSIGDNRYLFMDGYEIFQNNTYYFKCDSRYYAGYAYYNETTKTYPAPMLELSPESFDANISTNLADAAILAIPDQTYCGDELNPKITVKTPLLTLNQGTDYVVEYENNFAVGTAHVIVYGIGKYNGMQETTFQIVPSPITSATISTITDVTYNGAKFEPAIVVTMADNILTAGKDYTVSYSNNINIGTASVTINGINNYTGNIETSFNINAANIASAVVADIEAQTFNGAELNPTINVTMFGKKLTSDIDYTASYSNNTNVGTASVIINGKGNYSGKIETYFIINAANIESAVVADIEAQTFNGTEFNPTIEVTMLGKKLTSDIDYTVSYSNNTNVGTASVIINGKGNYSGKTEKKFNIEAIKITDATISEIDAQTFCGMELTPNFDVILNGAQLVAGTDYDYYYSDNTNAGIASLTINGKGNYRGTIKTSFQISSIEIDEASVEFIDCSSDKSALVVELADGTQLTENVDYNAEYARDGDIVNVKIVFKGNYNGSITDSYTQITTPVSEIVPQTKNVSVNIYPNPTVANQRFTIELHNVSDGAANVYIVKDDGSLVEKNIKSSARITMTLPAGEYICIAIINGKNVSQKFIVK